MRVRGYCAVGLLIVWFLVISFGRRHGVLMENLVLIVACYNDY